MVMFKSRMRSLTVPIFLGTLTLFSGSALAKQLRYATGFPPGSISAEAAKDYAKSVEKYSDGSLSLRIFPLSLLSAAETSDGLRDGIADIGYLLSAYFPGQYPHINFVSEASMQLATFDQEKLQGGKDTFAYNAAMTEFTFFHCPECNEEYKSQNQVYTSNGTSSKFALLCTKPVTSLSDLKGARLRVAGSHWSRWATELGATSLSLTINEIREALGQGVVDCNVQSAPELINLGLTEVVSHITMAVPGGVYAAASSSNVNLDVWRSLSEDQRRALLRAGGDLSALSAWAYMEREQDALRRAQAVGAMLHEAGADLINATSEFAKKDQATLIDYYANNHNVQRGQEMLDTFHSILVKWLDLVQEVESPQQLGDLYWDEIFSKVDVSQHGL